MTDETENNKNNDAISEEQETVDSTESKSLITAVVVVIVLALVYLGATYVAENKARTMVDRSIATLESDLQSQGRAAEVSYETLKVKRFSLTPQVTLGNLVITVGHSRRAQEATLEIPELHYYPESFSMQNYRIEKRGDVYLHQTKGGQTETIRVSHSSSPVLHVNRHNDGSRHYRIDVPEWVSFQELAEDVADAVTVNIDNKNSEIFWKQNPKGMIEEQRIALSGLSFVSEGVDLATIDAVSFKNKHEPTGEEGVHHFDTSFLIENLQFAANELQVLNPVNVVNEFRYEGPIPTEAKQMQDVPPMRWQIKNVAWMSGLLNLYVSGTVGVQPQVDKLPFGDLTLRINDVDKLLDYVAEQKPETEDYLEKVKTALESLSGTEVLPGETLAIKLVRDKNGHLTVGELTLEEALALVITVFLSMPDTLTDFSAESPTEAQPVPLEGEEGQATVPNAEEAEQQPAMPEATDEEAAVDLEADVDVRETEDGVEVTIDVEPETGEALDEDESVNDADTTTEAPEEQAVQ